MTAAMNGEFDILICEALDRLSRDQEDIAGLFKRMEFAGVKIFTLSEGVLPPVQTRSYLPQNMVR
jgi:DNA invertase Pin-like site-specific DNA recombinase